MSPEQIAETLAILSTPAASRPTVATSSCTCTTCTCGGTR